MAKIRCQMCGKKLPKDTINCTYCGARLVLMEGLEESHSTILKHEKDTDEFIDSIFSADNQDTESQSDSLEEEILNLVEQDESSVSDSLADMPDEIEDESNSEEANIWLNEVFSEEDSIPSEMPESFAENKENLSEVQTNESDDAIQLEDEIDQRAEEPETKDEIPEWFATILNDEESKEIISPPEEFLQSQAEEDEELPSKEKITWDDYSSEDKELKLPEWFAKTGEEHLSDRQDNAPEKKDELGDKKAGRPKKRQHWNWLTGRKKELPSEEDAVIETPEPTAFTGTAPLPGWFSEEGEEETSSEKEELFEAPEPTAFTGTAPLPGWLSEEGEEETSSEKEELVETPEPTAFEGTAPLPGWLSDQDEEETSSEKEELFGTPEPTVFEGTAPLPGWMSEEGEEETTSEKEELVEAPEPAVFKGTAPLPGWLSEEEIQPEEDAVFETPEPTAFEGTAPLPGWLSEEGEEETSSEKEELVEAPEPTVFEGTAPLPGWLSEEEIQPEEDAVFETPEPTVFEGTAPLPGWMSDEDEEELFDGTAPLPGWMSDEAEGQGAQPDEEISPDSLDEISIEDNKEEKDFLSWLSEEEIPLEDELPLADEISIEDDSLLPEEGIELPEYFSFDDLSSAEDMLQDSTTEDNIELPEWLEKQAVEYEESVVPEETANIDFNTIDFEFPLESQEEEGIPELSDELSVDNGWPQKEILPKTETISLSETDEQEFDTFSDDLEQLGDIPQWITESNTTSSFEGSLEETGPLKGLRGLLPTETSFLQHQPPPIFTSEINFTDEESRRISMMENILASENNTISKRKSHKRDYNISLRLILTAVLSLTIFLGLFVPSNLSANAISNPPTPVVQFYQLLQNNLQNASQRPVLLIVDTQPAHLSELRAYAELPMKALMESNTRILTFSSKPEGTFLSRAMLKEIMNDYQLNYDLDGNVFNIGFLTGGSTALRSFALNMRTTTYGLDVGISGKYVWDQPEIADIDSIDDFSTIIVMADTVEKAQRWIEQVGILLPESTQFLFVTSAQATPLLKAYLNSGQIDGLIGSPLDAAAYATLDNQINDAVLYWNAFRMAIITMIIVIICGALYYSVDSSKNIRLKKSKIKKKAGKK